MAPRVESPLRPLVVRLHLAACRQKAGVSLESIMAETKISRYFLEAIEAEEFDRLPGGVFNTNYLKQYAALIGYPVEELLEYYHQKTKVDEQTRKKTGRGRFPSLFSKPLVRDCR